MNFDTLHDNSYGYHDLKCCTAFHTILKLDLARSLKVKSNFWTILLYSTHLHKILQI